MIADDMLVYLLFQMILLIMNVLAFSKLPILSIFALIGNLLVAVGTVESFGEYYTFAIVLLLMNGTIPIFALFRNTRR